MDIINHFNKFTSKQLHLDIGKFVSLPNVAWNAWLLSFEPEFEFHTVKNKEQYDFCESAERGGIHNVVCLGLKQTLKEKLDTEYDLPRSRIHYTDINSLYASAMRYYQHVGNFELNIFHQQLETEKTME